MNKIKVAISHSHFSYITEWEFTGRIKYKKYPEKTYIEFEIIYTITYNKEISAILDIIKNIFTRKSAFFEEVEETKWIPEHAFRIIDLPEEIIVDCN